MDSLVINGTAEEAEILLQRKAREEMKLRLLTDIKADMSVCELMNTNKMEYIYELKDLIDNFAKENNK